MTDCLDQIALDLIEKWEFQPYKHPAQQKSALQGMIADALEAQRATGKGQLYAIYSFEHQAYLGAPSMSNQELLLISFICVWCAHGD